MIGVDTKTLLQIITENIDIGIAIIDKDRYIIYYNDAMGEIEGFDSNEVVNKHILDLFPSIDMKNSSLFRCLKTGKPIYNDLQNYINKKGKKIFSVITNIPIIEDGEVLGVIEFAEDINRIEKLYKSVDNWLNYPKINNMNSSVDIISYYNFDDFKTCNKSLINLIKKLKKVASYGSNVLIYGETGTGKEIFAQSIHNASSRKNKPFIAQNCAAIPENLLESILFGTEKGSFTGAITKEGLFEQANGGTLFLDELNTLPAYLQAKLLRVLQEGYIRRVGGNEVRKVNVRVIATVNEDPLELIESQRLRQDLFFRLSTLYIRIPPLRERKEDILFLTNYFVDKYSTLFNVPAPKLSKEVLDFFVNYDWKGNVRELINVIEYVIMTVEDSEEIQIKHLPAYLLDYLNRKEESTEYKNFDSYFDLVNNFERKVILKALNRNKWNVSKTAKDLKIKRQTLQNKIKKLNIK
ncbi:MAG: sigma 54-interacting transcriptional regulator [Tissierellia bacterium]|nr:sigma 54-interacting transcriptional regulator [Tissierellia bacterium]